jgi:DNA mismatch endonuclease (patch repair protein)
LVDVLTPDQRRLNMSRIRSRNTKPEMALRLGLHSRGFRFRLHCRNLPGCPDLVFPHYRTVILVHGCFWHGHACPMFKLPVTRAEFWAAKIAGNRTRDTRDLKRLAAAGWRTLVVWECALRGPNRQPVEKVLDEIAGWLNLDEASAVIQGGQCGPTPQNSAKTRQGGARIARGKPMKNDLKVGRRG